MRFLQLFVSILLAAASLAACENLIINGREYILDMLKSTEIVNGATRRQVGDIFFRFKGPRKNDAIFCGKYWDLSTGAPVTEWVCVFRFTHLCLLYLYVCVNELSDWVLAETGAMSWFGQGRVAHENSQFPGYPQL